MTPNPGDAFRVLHDSRRVSVTAEPEERVSVGRSSRWDEAAQDFRQTFHSCAAAVEAVVASAQHAARGDSRASRETLENACSQAALIVRTMESFLAREGRGSRQAGTSGAQRDPVRKSEWNRKLYEEKLAKGLCCRSGCVSPAAEGRVECVACTKRRRAQRRKRKARARGQVGT